MRLTSSMKFCAERRRGPNDSALSPAGRFLSAASSYAARAGDPGAVGGEHLGADSAGTGSAASSAWAAVLPLCVRSVGGGAGAPSAALPAVHPSAGQCRRGSLQRPRCLGGDPGPPLPLPAPGHGGRQFRLPGLGAGLLRPRPWVSGVCGALGGRGDGDPLSGRLHLVGDPSSGVGHRSAGRPAAYSGSQSPLCHPPRGTPQGTGGPGLPPARL